MSSVTILCTTSSFSANNFPEGFRVIYNPFKRRLCEDEVIDLLKKYQPDGMIAGVEPITSKVLNEAGRLKIISRCGVGLDTIDLIAANEKGIKVYNTPDAPASAVAELTVSMIFALIRNLIKMDTSIKKGNWEKINGSLLSEQTVGIIGCGRIGRHVASILHGTGCRIVGYDLLNVDCEFIERIPFPNLLTLSDVITLHIPLNPDNYHLIGADEMKKMKPGAILINTSRGGLIDEDALLKYLMNGHLGGAGLDVFEEEPYNGQLCQLDNVVLTPHIGSSAGKSRLRMEEESVQNLISGLKELSVI